VTYHAVTGMWLIMLSLACDMSWWHVMGTHCHKLCDHVR